MTPDGAALAQDLGELVRIPSVTGRERPAMERFAQLAERRGLRAEVIVHDLAALRAHPDHPGEEAAREELVGAEAVLPGRDPGAPRLCLNGHLDVVDPGEARWSFDPWAGDVCDGRLRGRGAADMKGGVVAALHALARLRAEGVRPRGDVVLQAVASEEDGGLGTFAALERDDRFAAALIPEPTAFDVVCAQAGALTFAGEVPGVGAHAALRRQGISAIDRYVAIHAALHEHERRVNAGPGHPLMAELDLPYPVSVGRIEGGTWSSSVPDRLRFEGRVGIRVDDSPAGARAALEAAVRAACPEARLTWTGG
ncbi:MAG TPA: M20/M25/M40 family metallo-hydrolase, partial [Solirubrobacteraceae bacterium]|nr:M20/M25/M40 family metallo-hydrolase [Solirubrobacteraceae bacterium]